MTFNYHIPHLGVLATRLQLRPQRCSQKMQRGSSRLYTAFINFKQAYDLIPSDKLWDHLYYCQMPQHLVSILQGLHHADEYMMLDGDKRANVQPSFGVKQGYPLSPLLFSIYLNGLAEGVQGAIMGIPNFKVTHLLFADDLSLTSTDHNELQTMLYKVLDSKHTKI